MRNKSEGARPRRKRRICLPRLIMKCCYLLKDKYKQFVANISLLGDEMGKSPLTSPGLPNHFLIVIPVSANPSQRGRGWAAGAAMLA